MGLKRLCETSVINYQSKAWKQRSRENAISTPQRKPEISQDHLVSATLGEDTQNQIS